MPNVLVFPIQTACGKFCGIERNTFRRTFVRFGSCPVAFAMRYAIS